MKHPATVLCLHCATADQIEDAAFSWQRVHIDLHSPIECCPHPQPALVAIPRPHSPFGTETSR